jgi:hypothetical protein
MSSLFLLFSYSVVLPLCVFFLVVRVLSLVAALLRACDLLLACALYFLVCRVFLGGASLLRVLGVRCGFGAVVFSAFGVGFARPALICVVELVCPLGGGVCSVEALSWGVVICTFVGCPVVSFVSSLCLFFWYVARRRCGAFRLRVRLLEAFQNSFHYTFTLKMVTSMFAETLVNMQHSSRQTTVS